MALSSASAMRWWEEWQLHVLVLSSLGVQCYLGFFASSRKSHIRPLYRFLIWLAYLAGDALAIYALATLFNRQRKLRYYYTSADGGGSRHDLEVLWAPLMLVHLGGQTVISAYNIEDNELWRRHILTAVSQVAVALYVFCKAWPSSADKRLLTAAKIMFVHGVFKCFDKPLALKRACFSSLSSSFHPAPRNKSRSREVELEVYIQEARDFVKRHQHPPRTMFGFRGQGARMKRLYIPDKLFVDYAYACTDRLTNLKSFWLIDDLGAYKVLRTGISQTFDLIYTKFWHVDDQNRATTCLGNSCSMFLWCFTMISPIVPTFIFQAANKEAYRSSDVTCTTILLFITYFLDLVSWSIASFFIDDWPQVVAQNSLIGFIARTRRHERLLRIAGFFGCKGLLDTYFGSKPASHSSKDITLLARQHVRSGWMSDITDIESYWRFSDSRGQWALERNGSEETLRWSIEKPFDESIVLWHLATDFCFHSKGTPPDSECPRMCREMSNYMMHLLFANPEMLLPGSRRILFTDAYDELKATLQGHDVSLLDEKGLTLKIIEMAESARDFTRDSWVLAQELMKIRDDKKMWEVIKGVWIEMLCFSAGRCRGYLHAKSLGSGGEFLTFISLLMSHAGLETYAERQQRVQLRLPKEERVRIAKQRIQPPSNQATGAMVPVEEDKNGPTPSACLANESLKEKDDAAIKIEPQTWEQEEDDNAITIEPVKEEEGNSSVKIVVSP